MAPPKQGQVAEPSEFDSKSFSVRASRRTDALRPPCLRAFIFDLAFPDTDFGPVAFSQGFQRWMAVACLLRRLSVQPFAILIHEFFVWPSANVHLDVGLYAGLG